MKKRKFALVLSGGGFKGAFQVGALNYLKDNWNQIAPEGILGDMLCANEALISRRMKHGKQKAESAVEAFVESEMVT